MREFFFAFYSWPHLPLHIWIQLRDDALSRLTIIVSTFFPRWCSTRASCLCDELMNIVCIRHHLVFRILTMLQRPTIWNLQIKTTQKCTQLNFATPKAMCTKILSDLPRYFTFHSYLPCANKILHSFCNAFSACIDFIALLSLSPSSSMC